jgi:hypothetical protein
MIAIASATRCACGLPVLLMQIDSGPGRRWQAHCDECACTPPPQVSAIAGYGGTPEEALWDWQVTADLERQVQLVPVTTLGDLERQVQQEGELSRGWSVRVAVFDGIAGHYFCPPDAPWTTEQVA